MQNPDQYKNGNYGFYSLSDVVDRYMAQSFNNGRKYYKNMLVIATGAWKEIYWKTLRIPKTKRVLINLSTMTVREPDDCMKVIGLKLRDNCSRAIPLTYDATLMTNVLPQGCGCKKCNCKSSDCASVNGMSYLTEDVVIDGNNYPRITKTRVNANGDLLQEITEPFARVVNGVTTIVNRTHSNHVASLEVKTCGCLENTLANKRKCYDFGCCPVECCAPRCSTNRDGKYKIEDHIIYLYDSCATSVDITYISNGEECSSEIMMPEYCTEAMYAALYLGSIRFRQGVGPYEKRDARQNLAVEKQNLYEFLNPIVPHEFIELQQNFPKW